MWKLTIIEDDEGIRRELADHFVRLGFSVIAPESWENIRQDVEGADAVLLDIQLGEKDGIALCREIRAVSSVPVLFVTCQDSEQQELAAICAGGDDFIRKPYSLPVLTARAQRILRRNSQAKESITVENATLNLVFGQIEYQGEQLELSKKEQQMLYFLFLNEGRVVPRDELVEYLWDNKWYVDENILNVNLSRLRKRLGEIGLGELIRTVPKQGYLAGKERI
jgi:two-component system response regulator protein BraR/BceR